MQISTYDKKVVSAVAPSDAHHVRLVRMDCFRIIAAVAVIWIHVPHSPELRWTTLLCRFAVPFFIAGVAFFAFRCGTKPECQFTSYITSRSIKLYLPFLFWTFVYVAFKLVKKSISPDEQIDLPGIEFLWFGGAYHLWFIPFALLVSIVSFGVGQSVRHCSERQRVFFACSLSIVVAISSLYAVPTINWTPQPICYMFDALPAALFGLSMAILWQLRDRLWLLDGGRAATTIAIFALIFSGVLLSLYGRNVTLESISGIACFAIGLNVRSGQWESKLSSLGRFSMGIYLVHLLFVKVSESFGNEIHFDPVWILDLGAFAFTLFASCLFVWLLGRYKLTAWTVV